MYLSCIIKDQHSMIGTTLLSSHAWKPIFLRTCFLVKICNDYIILNCDICSILIEENYKF